MNKQNITKSLLRDLKQALFGGRIEVMMYTGEAFL